MGSEMSIRDRYGLVCLRIKFFQHLDRTLGIHAIGDEFFAASENSDVKRCSDLAQIFINRTTQIGQPIVVDRVR